MALTENGVAVADGVRGATALHEPPPGAGKAPGIPDVHEDGFFLRSRSGAPQHPAVTVTGRLDEDEVTAAPEPDVPAVLQAPRMTVQLPPAPAGPAVTG